MDDDQYKKIDGDTPRTASLEMNGDAPHVATPEIGGDEKIDGGTPHVASLELDREVPHVATHGDACHTTSLETDGEGPHVATLEIDEDTLHTGSPEIDGEESHNASPATDGGTPLVVSLELDEEISLELDEEMPHVATARRANGTAVSSITFHDLSYEVTQRKFHKRLPNKTILHSVRLVIHHIETGTVTSNFSQATCIDFPHAVCLVMMYIINSIHHHQVPLHIIIPLI